MHLITREYSITFYCFALALRFIVLLFLIPYKCSFLKWRMHRKIFALTFAVMWFEMLPNFVRCKCSVSGLKTYVSHGIKRTSFHYAMIIDSSKEFNTENYFFGAYITYSPTVWSLSSTTPDKN